MAQRAASPKCGSDEGHFWPVKSRGVIAGHPDAEMTWGMLGLVGCWGRMLPALIQRDRGGHVLQDNLLW
eukprot:2395562-Rhodomonas_salina.1